MQRGYVGPQPRPQAADQAYASAFDIRTERPSTFGNYVPPPQLLSISIVDPELSMPPMLLIQRRELIQQQHAVIQAALSHYQQQSSQVVMLEDGASPAGDSTLGSSPDSQIPAYPTPMPALTPAEIESIIMPFQGSRSRLRSYDWIMMKGSCHYVRDATTFIPGTYTYLRTPIEVEDGLGRRYMVPGYGSIGLVVWTVPAVAGGRNITAFSAHHVLHIPLAICNVWNPTSNIFRARPRSQNNCRIWTNNRTPPLITQEFWGLERIQMAMAEGSSSVIDAACRQLQPCDLDSIRKRVEMYLDVPNLRSLAIQLGVARNPTIPWCTRSDLDRMDYDCFPNG